MFYDLILVLFGMTLGVFAAEPIKKLFTGKYQEEARQKKRVKLLLYLREEKNGKSATTGEMVKNVFSNKADPVEVNTYLSYIAEAGLIKQVNNSDDPNEKSWKFVKTIR
ncbi:hypothetical protein [Salisediminibacterium beveridgei]|uniref:Uncharacterized protein n=1 Tax=Salisediminibacterium beveridgei TaxID=632773 RepID=A0A1D7QWR9_9BACI|nr:hypothetical protein [Salisediminibacterium beveridgei]AOM83465.1 hypothetical protein BBEV_2107 [Salisediminibacterium beveridgei]